MSKLMNGEHWRIITPILLSLLSALSALNMWILGDVKQTVRDQAQIILSHVQDYSIHIGGRSNGTSKLAFLSSSYKSS